MINRSICSLKAAVRIRNASVDRDGIQLWLCLSLITAKLDLNCSIIVLEHVLDKQTGGEVV